ncbi:MAG TPA: PEP-CTERM sorting domain-containing protein [Planctomycetota bacterium]|nr:PEP-CTERM sorting domain-containing protein [Planctomycetota bacterium]
MRRVGDWSAMRAMLVALCAVAMGLAATDVALALPVNYAEYGTTVTGYQDYFRGTTLNPGWTQYDGGAGDPSMFTLPGDGRLHVASPTTAASNDPNKLLYTAVSYNTTVQEVLARIKVTTFGTADGCRVGVATASSTSNGYGINLLFRPEGSAHDLHLLNDAVAWGPAIANDWSLDTYYWVRVRHDPNMIGSDDSFGKIWLADGLAPEPAGWQVQWASNDTRTGYAGITGGSVASNGAASPAVFEVDYILIKAAGSGMSSFTASADILTYAELQPSTFNDIDGRAFIYDAIAGTYINPDSYVLEYFDGTWQTLATVVNQTVGDLLQPGHFGLLGLDPGTYQMRLTANSSEYGDWQWVGDVTIAVPEPATMALLGAGLLVLARRRRTAGRSRGVCASNS